MALTLTLFGAAAIVALTAISGFFSSSELAVFSIARHRIDALVAAETPGSDSLAALKENPHRFLVTVLVSNNVANIAAASVATAVFVQFLPASQAATGATVFTSVFVIVLGEIAPKSYAVAHAEKHALRVARPIVVIQRVLRPLLFIFEVATNAVNRLTGGESGFESYLSREEIETIVLSGEETGVLDSDEGALIRRVLDLEETVVRAVMVPRTEMVAVSIETTPEEAIERFRQRGVTRMPVYKETHDTILGMLDIRDALDAAEDGRAISEIITDVPVVPASKPIDELLAEMQTEATQMAIVVDEFGTVVGLVTREDVIEEIVGEIFDRGEINPVTPRSDGTAVVAGNATIAYTNQILKHDLPTEGPFETVSGLLNHHLGRIPEEGDRIELSGVRIVVLDTAATRVRRVRIEPIAEHGADQSDP
ncbi:hemolysin family protein [Halalkalirubrum salinum]|uniref:hemolysin family protein n=1 Tax=Halalkalirubrum salinum TaxID=2563889 RepID=UPI0010FB0622|nr:hemolysin family protein [Halalkalirubrum salinum]